MNNNVLNFLKGFKWLSPGESSSAERYDTHFVLFDNSIMLIEEHNIENKKC